MPNKKFLFVGMLLLALSMSSLFVFIYTLNLSNHLPSHPLESIPFWYSSICKSTYSGGGCGGDQNDIIGKSILDTLTVEYEWSKKMSIDNTDSISVFLVAPADSAISDQENSNNGIPINPISGASIPSSKDNRQIALDTPFLWDAAHNCEGTDLKSLDPCTINGVFGSKYEAFASAHLIANAFDIQLMEPEEASVNQNSIEWDWNIQPKIVGTQVINLDIDIRWKPVASGDEILRQVWRTRITIEVDQPFLNSQQITFISLSSVITALLSALASIGITVPSVYTSIKNLFIKKGLEQSKVIGKSKNVDNEQRKREFKKGEDVSEKDNNAPNTLKHVPRETSFE